MRYAALVFTAAAVLAGVASPALAQSAADTADVRCMMVLQAISRDPAQREQAGRGLFYYVGRVTARGPLARIEPMMIAEGKKMSTPQQVQAELARCGAELNKNGGELQAINQKLQKQFGPPPGAAPPAKK
jgi:hypothetical protein